MSAEAPDRDRGVIRPVATARRAEVDALLSRVDVGRALERHGTPLLLLEPERVRAQYRRLVAALPFVRFHYAVKALPHETVLAALADEGCGFDVATTAEIQAVTAHAVNPERIIHTHPVKKPQEISDAVAAGVRTFVVDSPGELAKFAGLGPGIRVLVRLSYRSPQAKSDLSSKFGVGPFEAGHLVEQALAQGTPVAGFSFHVGSQLDDPARFVDAISDTLTLMDHLQHVLPVRFDTLDIGGGFPVAYDSPVASIEHLADAIRPLLEPRARDLDIIAEPGRILAAEAMTLVTSVIGVSERSDGRWYFLDDGVYGAYSNVVAEDVHPLVLPVAPDAGADTHRWSTLAGPTCDSADVIAREALLPDLAVGDLLASPAMGAYTLVTATRFNGRPVTPVVVLEAASAPASAPEPELASIGV